MTGKGSLFEFYHTVIIGEMLLIFFAFAQTSTPLSATCHGGVCPSLGVRTDTAPTVPAGLPKRSEAGVGALFPWANKLYMVTYLSVPQYGAGAGLYEIDEDMSITKIKNHSGVFANRMIHHWTDSAIIGPYVIDQFGGVRTITDLLLVRIGAMAEHLFHPETMVYMVSMDGPLYEVDLTTLQARQIANLVDELDIPISPDPHTTGQCYPHFKDALTVHATADGKGGVTNASAGGILYVVSNGYNEADFVNGSNCGRLASWNGAVGKKQWNVLSTTAHYGLAARKNYGRVTYATGWDRKSAILSTRDMGSADAPTLDNGWKTLRLPKASHAFDHGWQTEWPRIREVETERYLLDVHGMFYELSPLGWAASTFGVRPICQHLRVIPDFTTFRGLLVMGGNEGSSIFDNNIVTGQAQSGLWLGKTDDLWGWGKPQGWGSVFLEEPLRQGQASDPMLMTGFDHKVVHLSIDSSNTTERVRLAIELDTLGTALRTGRWRRVAVVELNFNVALSAYKPYVFEEGMTAHWARVVALDACDMCTATFMYT
mgnify:CR=1 FL=1